MSRINVYTDDDEYEGSTLAGWFTPERAEKVEGDTEWDGNNMADVHVGANRWQRLYRTAQGRYVVETRSAWVNEQTTHRFLTDEQAREWLLVNNSDEHVERWFGELEEEKGPGRPAIGPMVNVRLGAERTARIDAACTEGESRAAAIRRLLDERLDELDELLA